MTSCRAHRAVGHAARPLTGRLRRSRPFRRRETGLAVSRGLTARPTPASTSTLTSSGAPRTRWRSAARRRSRRCLGWPWRSTPVSRARPCFRSACARAEGPYLNKQSAPWGPRAHHRAPMRSPGVEGHTPRVDGTRSDGSPRRIATAMSASTVTRMPAGGRIAGLVRLSWARVSVFCPRRPWRARVRGHGRVGLHGARAARVAARRRVTAMNSGSFRAMRPCHGRGAQGVLRPIDRTIYQRYRRIWPDRARWHAWTTTPSACWWPPSRVGDFIAWGTRRSDSRAFACSPPPTARSPSCATVCSTATSSIASPCSSPPRASRRLSPALGRCRDVGGIRKSERSRPTARCSPGDPARLAR